MNQKEQLRPVRQDNLRLISGNNKKTRLFNEYFPGAGVIHPDGFFSEEAIKVDLDSRGPRETNYPSLVSQEKVRGSLEFVEPGDTVVSADAVILVPKPDGGFFPLNRDGGEVEPWMLETVQKNKEVVFSGAVSAGRKDGAIYSIQTYTRIPLAEGPTELPIAWEDLQRLSAESGQKVEMGVVEPVAEVGKPMAYTFNPLAEVDPGDMDGFMPFLSGLQKDAMEALVEAVEWDRQLAPAIQDVISASPFNTIKYLLMAEHNIGSILQENGSGATRGGDSNFFSMKLLERVLPMLSSETQIHIGTYDVEKWSSPKAHTNILIEGDRVGVVLDPGLTIPHPLIYSEIFPFQPLRYGDGRGAKLQPNKYGFLTIGLERVNHNGTKKACVHINERGRITVDEIGAHIEQVTPQLIRGREEKVVYDVQDRNGVKVGGLNLFPSGEIKIFTPQGPTLIQWVDEALGDDIAVALEQFGFGFDELVLAHANMIRYGNS